MEKREMTEKINQILIWYCKESWFDNVVHWLVLWWTPCFEGLDVCLKGLAQRISRVFPVSIQPNWADRQRNSAWLILDLQIYIYPFVQFSSSARLCKYEHRRGYGVRRRKAGTKSLLPKLGYVNNDWGWGLEHRPAGISLFANRHRWPWPEQGIRSVGQHPMGEPWALVTGYCN